MKRQEIILEESSNRFNAILEYITPNNFVSEAEPNADAQQPAPADPNAGAPAPGGEMGVAPMPGADPNAPMGPDAGVPAPGGDMGAAPMPGADPNAPMGPEAPMPADPNAPIGPDALPAPETAPEGQPGPEDNVLDIDDLTDAQSKTNDAIMGLDNKFGQLLNVVDKFLGAIEKNDAEIANLKQELEKRNPTPLEKLNLRTVNDSFPFNVKPADFWKEKEATSNYRIGDDDEKDPVQYELTTSDIENDTDWKKISDSIDDDETYSSLGKLLNY